MKTDSYFHNLFLLLKIDKINTISAFVNKQEIFRPKHFLVYSKGSKYPLVYE